MTPNNLKLILIIAVSIILLAWFFLGWDSEPEGYADVDAPEEPTRKDRADFFHYQLSPVEKPGIIPVHPGLQRFNKQDVDAATSTPAWFGKSGLFSKFFYTHTSDMSEKDRICRQASKPLQLAKRTVEQEAGQEPGCGWWYVDDFLSTGALGTPDGGPENKDVSTQFPGGRWVWNLSDAQRLEDIKQCRAITNCRLLIDGCGFCTQKMHGIPVKADGTPKYPEDATGSCGGTILTEATACPPDVIRPRLLTGDYDYDINGNVVLGDQTANVRLFQKAQEKGGQIAVENVCSPDVNGRLSAACRQQLCVQVASCVPNKGLHRMIGVGKTNETDRSALDIISKRGALDIPDALWVSDGAISLADASDVLGKLKALATSGPTSLVKDAAKYMLNETTFNICDFQPNEQGPFPLECLQREFRKVGCQASGSEYPSSTATAAANTFGSIRTQFRDLFDKMTASSASAREQDDAVQKCLGIQIPRAAEERLELDANQCRDPGIEYVVYYGTQDGRILIVRRFLQQDGRLLQGEALAPMFAAAIGPTAGVARFYGYMARTYIQSGSDAEFLVFGTSPQQQTQQQQQRGIYSLQIDGGNKRQVEKSGKLVVELAARQRHEVRIWFESATTNIGTPSFSVPSSRLLLGQSFWKPMISLQPVRAESGTTRWEDQNGFGVATAASTIQDRGNGDLAASGITPVQLLFPTSNADAATKPTVFLTASQIRVLTCRVWISGLDTQMTVFQLDRGSDDESMSLQLVERRPVFQIQTEQGSISVRARTGTGSTIPTGAWTHFAITVSPTVSQIRIYINGVDKTDATPSVRGQPTIPAISRILFGSTTNMEVGWMHVYNRPLNEQELLRDMGFLKGEDRDSEVARSASAPTHGFTLTQGTILNGGGNNEVFRELETTTLAACMNAAGSDTLNVSGFSYGGASGKQCKLYRYVDANSVDTGGKDQIGTRPFLRFLNIRAAGRPLRTVPNIRSFQACGDLCTKESCAGFAYETNTQSCALLRTIESQTPANGFVSGRMAHHSGAADKAAIRGGCPEGMYEYGRGSDATMAGKCCPEKPRDPNNWDYQTCGTVGACSLNPSDKFMNPCKNLTNK